jgi:uncharacterized protein YabE (DUF348 family)
VLSRFRADGLAVVLDCSDRVKYEITKSLERVLKTRVYQYYAKHLVERQKIKHETCKLDDPYDELL